MVVMCFLVVIKILYKYFYSRTMILLAYTRISCKVKSKGPFPPSWLGEPKRNLLASFSLTHTELSATLTKPVTS
jgi:hypothetical protein